MPRLDPTRHGTHAVTQATQSEGLEAPAGYRGLLVIIPTRNRSDLAVRAICSTLDAPSKDRVQVLVSDNSTQESEIATLGEYCRSLRDDRVRYVRPSEPLRMADHWEWVFQHALDHYDSSHLTVLTDRRVFRRRGLHELCNLARRYPDTVISSLWDDVYDHLKPIRVRVRRWSGKLVKVHSNLLLADNARASAEALEAVPTPMISVIPRGVFRRIRERFGNYCLSYAPDYCFGYRLLDIEDSILKYDKTMTFASGSDRSNGFALMRGLTTKETSDFVTTNGGTEFGYWATPCPQIWSGYNGMFQEYNFVRSESRSGHFPEIDFQSYLELLNNETISQCEDSDSKARRLEILVSHGLREPDPSPAAPTPFAAPTPAQPRSLIQRFQAIRAREPDKPLWRLLPERLTAVIYWSLRRRLWREYSIPLWWGLHRLAGVPLPSWLNEFGFASVDEAIEFLHGSNRRVSR
jgi:hypothetical protein